MVQLQFVEKQTFMLFYCFEKLYVLWYAQLLLLTKMDQRICINSYSVTQTLKHNILVRKQRGIFTIIQKEEESLFER